MENRLMGDPTLIGHTSSSQLDERNDRFSICHFQFSILHFLLFAKAPARMLAPTLQRKWRMEHRERGMDRLMGDVDSNRPHTERPIAYNSMKRLTGSPFFIPGFPFSISSSSGRLRGGSGFPRVQEHGWRSHLGQGKRWPAARWRRRCHRRGRDWRPRGQDTGIMRPAADDHD
jgi:hypothetical protein